MEKSSRKIQYAAGLCASFTMVYQGMLLGWTSPMIPKLLSGEPGFTLSKKECSWVASLVAYGAAPGCLMAQYFGDKIGRRKTILFMFVPCMIGSIITVFSKSAILLYIARLINGIGCVMAVVVVSIYLAEISDKEIRGAMGTLLMLMANVGNLLIYTIGPFVSYMTMNLICLSIPLIFFLICIWIPESPYYYLKIDKFDEAKKEMMRLKSLTNKDLIEKDLIEIERQVKKDMERKTSIKELFTQIEYRKAVIILVGLKILQQLTGSLVIQSYLETILREAGTSITGPIGSMIYGIIQLFSGILSAILVDKMGRKPLLYISSLGTGLSLTAIGLYFYFKLVNETGEDVLLKLSWLPLLGLIGFNIFYSIGLSTLPYVLQSEIFPTNVKSAASSVMTIFGATMAASLTLSYQSLTDILGIYTVFWILASVAYGGILFIHYYVPETKGKTLEEIQRAVNTKKFDKNVENQPETVPLQNV